MKEVINFWTNLYYSDKAFLVRQLFKNTALLFCKVFTLERSGTMWVKVYIGFVLLFISFKGFSHSGEESKLPSSLSNGENIQESATPGEKAEPSSNLSEEDIKLACEAPFQTPLLNQEQYSVAKLKLAMISMDYKALRREYPYLPIDDEFRLWELYKKYKDNRSFQVLFLSGLHLVHHATWDFIKRREVEYEDYFHVAIPAFLRAIEKFDPSQGTRLNQFAHTLMRREMSRYREEEDRIVAVPRGALKTTLMAALSADKSIPINESWIKKFAEEHPEYDIEKIRFILPYVRHGDPYSLDSSIKSDIEDDDLTWLETLSDEKPNTERQAISEMDISQIYDWTVKAVREQKELGKEKFSRKLNFYYAVIDGRIFTHDREKVPRTDIGEQFGVSHTTVGTTEKVIRGMIKDQFPHSGYEAFKKLADLSESVDTQSQSELDIQQLYNRILAVVRNKKRFQKRIDLYEVIVSDRIFALFPRSVYEIAAEFKVSHQTVLNHDETIRQMIKGQLPHSGDEVFQESATNTENAGRPILNGINIQKAYDWTMEVIRTNTSKKKFRKGVEFYEMLLRDHILTPFPRTIQDIAKEARMLPASVHHHKRMIQQMIKDRFLSSDNTK